jgi:hypothetical protein
MYSNDDLSLSLSRSKLAVCWLNIGLIAFIIATIYAIIAIIIPFSLVTDLFTNTDIFQSTLLFIIFNLYIIVLPLSTIASIWSCRLGYSIASTSFLILAFIGTILIAISPFYRQNFLIANYSDAMSENILYILGISAFGVALLLLAIWQVIKCIVDLLSTTSNNDCKLIKFAIFSSSLIFILVWVCFTLSYFKLNEVIKLVAVQTEFYYQLLFWSGGHLLQFIYTQILILIWVDLFYFGIDRKLKFNKLYPALLYLNFAICIISILGHIFYDIVDSEFKNYYDTHAKIGIIIAPALSIILMFYEKISKQYVQDFKFNIIIICSSMLFLLGRFLSIATSTSNAYYYSLMGAIIAFGGLSVKVRSIIKENKDLALS